MREALNPKSRRVLKKTSTSREARRSRFSTESELYTIDNTEDIYGTKLLPNQRCYVDPWDLENYDYVRRKIDHSPSPSSYYSISDDAINNNVTANNYSCITPPYAFYSDYELESYRAPYADQLYEKRKMNIPDYYKEDENDFGVCSGVLISLKLTDLSSSSSCNEGMMLPAPSYHGPYEYCSPYASLRPPYVSDCYECNLDFIPRCSSLIYDTCMVGGGMSSLYGSTGNYSLKRPSASSLYEGIYSHKFGLSKKGLLKIDYSCSWNELDRAISRSAEYMTRNKISK